MKWVNLAIAMACVGIGVWDISLHLVAYGVLLMVLAVINFGLFVRFVVDGR